jgi:serine/threonine protein kinase
VVDFGQAVHLDGDCGVLNRRSGTPAYMAPEVIKQCYGAKADMWCVGVMLYQLLSNRMPFWGTAEQGVNATAPPPLKDVWESILLSEADLEDDTHWAGVGDEAKDVVRQLLCKDPDARPAANEMMEHPWFELQLGSELAKLRRLLDKTTSPQVLARS